MRFSTLVFRNLTRRAYRSLLTLTALATAIACVISLLGIANGFTKSFADVYAAHSVDIVVSRQGAADRLSSSIDQQAVGKIQALSVADRASGVLLETLSFEEQSIFGVPTMGIERGSWILNDYDLKAGKLFSANNDPELLLGIHLADRLNAVVGQTLRLFDKDFRVQGIYASQSAWENGSMVLPLDQLQALTDRNGQLTYINVILRRPIDQIGLQNAVKSIQAIDPRILAMATDEFVRTDSRMQLASAMAWMTSTIALVIGAIGTLNTMMTSVMERTVEIGILRAIGWPKRRVVLMILLESCGLAIAACIIGSILATLLTWGLGQSSIAKGILRPSIDLAIFAQGWLLAIGIGLIGAGIPAWRASQMLPTSAFRVA